MGLIGRGARRFVVVASAVAATPTPLAAAATPTPLASATRTAPAPAGQVFDLVLPLRADLPSLRRFALAVSTPGSPQYGAYRSVSELSRRFGAATGTRRLVARYLRGAGAKHVQVDVTGLFAQASVTPRVAQRLFGVRLQQFRTGHGASFAAPALAAGPPRVPGALRGAVRGVVGLDTRSLPMSAAPRGSSHLRPLSAHAASQPSSIRTRSGTPVGCGAAIASGGFTPNQYLTAYGYDPLHAQGLTGQGQRVALIEIDGFKYSDVQHFASCFGLPIPALNGFGVGVSKPLAPGGEATLDLEVLDAAAPGLRSIDVYEARARAADTLRALTAPLRSRQKPQVISVSLGLCEPALYAAVGRSGIGAAEGAMEMAAASGVTVLAASGDQGAADCTGPGGVPLRLLAVNYPASSWWATAVGGTNLVLDPANGITDQLVWNDAALSPGSAGGGGSSRLFRRPNYQNGVVAGQDRAIPDVSMLADIGPGYAIYCSSRPDCINRANASPWQAVGGTSAATPLLAGGFALIDQALRARRQRPLGLINPLLYRTARSSAAASVYSDVTAIGNDIGPELPPSRTPLGCCAAHPGYDAASGLGSLRLAAFAASALGAQPPEVRLALSLPVHQHSLRTGRLLATVTCSSACITGAYVRVSAAGRGLEVDSRVVRLPTAGGRTLTMRFTRAQLRQLRAASRRRLVFAVVRGVLFDPDVLGVLPRPPGYAIQKQTAPRRLRLVG